MVKNLVLCVLVMAMSMVASAQQLRVKWEELTAEDFVKALQLSGGTCVMPFGIVEKHGPSGPLGTDLLNVRAATLQAVKTEYSIVFPEYYFGQIAEARHSLERLRSSQIYNWLCYKLRPMRWDGTVARR